jgi:K+-transporting ATPase KdpF subunit
VNTVHAIALIVAILLGVYLVYALFSPEKL